MESHVAKSIFSNSAKRYSAIKGFILSKEKYGSDQQTKN